MAETPREIYASSNGDVWLLIGNPEPGPALVRHQANLSSGGQVTDWDIERFLRLGNGPEQQALRQLLAEQSNRQVEEAEPSKPVQAQVEMPYDVSSASARVEPRSD